MCLDAEKVEEIKNFTIDDFLVQLTPFYNLMLIEHRVSAEQYKGLIEARARELKISKAQFNSLLRSVNAEQKTGLTRTTQFIGQRTLLCGDWNVTDVGIFGKDTNGFNTVACSHPILPKERLTNIDTGIEKMVLTFKRGERDTWKDITIEKGVLASPTSILSLANKGVDVTSINAKELIRYLSDMDNKNYDIIPQKNSVTRLGYIDGAGFSPYVDELVFDGDENYKNIFNSVKSCGNYEKWLELAKEIRQKSITARIVLAAAFASVLVKPCGALPFFVHLWGVDSGTGKTVALMLAASVWGNPQPGYYVQTFNSTVVGQEKLAAFLNHLPLCIDELQLAGNKNDFDVYKLAEGVGRTRGNKGGGIEKTPTWANAIITTGESPITSSGAGAGAVNRVIDIECRAEEKVIENGHAVVEVLRANYGHAGQCFADLLYNGFKGRMPEVAMQLFKDYLLDFQKTDTTEKQAMAAALIATADALATDWIFKDDNNLTVEELSAFLKTKAEVSAGERGYDYICDWISENSNRFMADHKEEVIGSIYGKIEGNYVYIINSVFKRACEEGGFNSSALISYLKSQKVIEIRNGKSTQVCRLGSNVTRCIKIKSKEQSFISDIDCDF